MLITCWRLGSVDGGTLSSTESDRSAIIKRELISRSSSSSIHNGPLVVRSCTEAPASLGGTALCSTAPCANVKGRHIPVASDGNGRWRATIRNVVVKIKYIT